MRYLALRRRADLLVAALEAGGWGEPRVLRIVGGLPEDAPMLQTRSPVDPQPEPLHPPRMAGFPADPEPSD